MKVTSPDGATWRISRRWVPWRRRVKGVLDSLPDVGYTSMGDDPISAIIAIVLLVLLIPFVLLAILASLEILLVLLVLPFAILGRVLFGRHWTVEVRRGWKPYAEEQAGDWQDSGTRIHDLADRIRRGDLPPAGAAFATDPPQR